MGERCTQFRFLGEPAKRRSTSESVLCESCLRSGRKPEDAAATQIQKEDHGVSVLACGACCRPLGERYHVLVRGQDHTVVRGLIEERGDLLCRRCRAVFRAARVLISESNEEEAVIVPTLAFAALVAEGVPVGFIDIFSRHRSAAGLTFVKQGPVDGVLLLRQEPAIVEVQRYKGSTLPKRIRIRAFLRSAKPEIVAKLYKQTLCEQGIPTDKSISGRLEWAFEAAHLFITIDSSDELHPIAAAHLANAPQEQRPSFPPPNLVKGSIQIP